MNIRASFLSTAAALILAGCGGGDAGTGPDPDPVKPANPVASATVTAGNNNRFSPSNVDLIGGGTVTWTFGSVPHNVIFNSTAGAPANVPVVSNTEEKRTFNTAGTFPYDCTLHAGMTGTITVHPPAQSTGDYSYQP